VTEHGVECSCPDWVYSRDGKDPKGCKHVASLRALTLLPPAPPARSTGDLAANDPDAYDRLQEDWDDGPAPEPMTDADMQAMADYDGEQ
jgi:hypothetical protein